MELLACQGIPHPSPQHVSQHSSDPGDYKRSHGQKTKSTQNFCFFQLRLPQVLLLLWVVGAGLFLLGQIFAVAALLSMATRWEFILSQIFFVWRTSQPSVCFGTSQPFCLLQNVCILSSSFTIVVCLTHLVTTFLICFSILVVFSYYQVNIEH